jgi:hypothetical protein
MLAGHVGSDCDLVVARFGHISAIPGNEIRFGNAGGVPEFSTPAYLAELQSWPGMSGAPTFVYYSVSRNILTGSSVSPPITNPAVLGLVSGHLGCRLGKSEDTLSGGDYQMVVKSGIAAIVPAHYVHELLAEAEL